MEQVSVSFTACMISIMLMQIFPMFHRYGRHTEVSKEDSMCLKKTICCFCCDPCYLMHGSVLLCAVVLGFPGLS